MAQLQTPIQDNVFAVTITVVTPAGGKPELQFNPDPVKLTKVSNALILYYLVSPGYYFPTDGTALVIEGDDEGKQFPLAWLVNASTIALADFNNNSEHYKYTVTVVNATSGARITTDPIIENDTER